MLTALLLALTSLVALFVALLEPLLAIAGLVVPVDITALVALLESLLAIAGLVIPVATLTILSQALRALLEMLTTPLFVLISPMAMMAMSSSLPQLRTQIILQFPARAVPTILATISLALALINH
jgi:hypothetical protein